MSITRRPNALALRHQERQEIERRRDADQVDEAAARRQAISHLRQARMALLEGRLVVAAAEVSTFIRMLEQR